MTLKKGATAGTIGFPIRTIPGDPGVVKVRLVGTLPASPAPLWCLIGGGAAVVILLLEKFGAGGTKAPPREATAEYTPTEALTCVVTEQELTLTDERGKSPRLRRVE